MSGILILGGGLTGLVAAERLGASGIEATVLEKEAVPGGACRSFEVEGFTFDLTGHLLHTNREETERYLEELGVWGTFEEHVRAAGVVIGGHVTPYPVQINTHGLSPEVRRDCLLGFVRAWADREELAPNDFREWVLERFGEGLADHFFFPYNRKLYRAEPEELSLDWVGRYVPKPSLEEVVDGALGLHQGRVGYNATFHYPRQGGIEVLPGAVAARVAGLRTEAEVQAVSLEGRWVELDGGERLDWDRLVATCSLPALVDMLVDSVPDDVVAARRSLRWVSVFNLALGVEGSAPREEHWLYFPDEDLPFYRVGFPSNHGKVAPEDCHTVSVEVSLDPGPRDTEALQALCERSLEELGFLEPEAVRVRHLAVIDPAYVVFDHDRKEAVATLRRFLRGHGVEIAGRWAEWKYSAMEDAVLDGMRVARGLGRESRP